MPVFPFRIFCRSEVQDFNVLKSWILWSEFPVSHFKWNSLSLPLPSWEICPQHPTIALTTTFPHPVFGAFNVPTPPLAGTTLPTSLFTYLSRNNFPKYHKNFHNNGYFAISVRIVINISHHWNFFLLSKWL